MGSETEAPAILRLSPAAVDLARLYPWLEAAAEHANIPTAMRNAMHIALEEVVANVAMHAFPAGAAGEIVVAFTASPSEVGLAVEDTGRPFDPSRPIPLTTTKAVEDAQPGGLGLTLLRHFCRDIRYERIGSRNRLMLGFNVPTSSP